VLLYTATSLVILKMLWFEIWNYCIHAQGRP